MDKGVTWNCRVIHHKIDGGCMFSVHEVYYDKDKKPVMYSENPVAVMEENIEYLKSNVDKIKQAFDKPTLEGGIMFPNEYKL